MLIAIAAFGLLAPQEFTRLQPLPGAPLLGLTTEERARFEAGKAEFEAIITEAEGLGPVFNGRSCAECHSVPAVGGSGRQRTTRFAQGTPYSNLEALGGGVLQSFSIDPSNCVEVVPQAADIVALRRTPQLFGAGLIEAIPDSSVAVGGQFPGEGVSGRSRQVLSVLGEPPAFGEARYGWKLETATLFAATAGELVLQHSITTPAHPGEQAPQGDVSALAACDAVIDPESAVDATGSSRTGRIADFLRFLAPPPQTPRSGHSGELQFTAARCNACHRRSFAFIPSQSAAIAGTDVKPYSGFKLHDMGALGDGIRDGGIDPADGAEMGARALWGLALRPELLHDGRASHPDFDTRVQQAIQFHDGEGTFSRTQFDALTAPNRQLLLDFLATLGRAEFDADADNDRDLDDWALLAPMFTGPLPPMPILPESPGAITDADQDRDFDLDDFGMFAEAIGSDLPNGLSASTLDLRVESAAGDDEVLLIPGEDLEVAVLGELLGPDSGGLAYISIDLAISGEGTLSPLAIQSVPAELAALTHPFGYGGVSVGSELLGAGGAQNTIQNQMAPAPRGPVLVGIAEGAAEALLRTTVTAPMEPGVYTVQVTRVQAGVLRPGGLIQGAYPVDRARTSTSGFLTLRVGQSLGSTYCPANPNSSGGPAVMGAFGSDRVSDDDFELFVFGAARNIFGVFLTSRTQGFIGNPGGSAGNVCLGGDIGRFLMPGQLGNTDDFGSRSIVIPLDSMAQPSGLVQVVAGDTWNFTYWFRDSVQGLVTNNFAGGLEVTFQ